MSENNYKEQYSYSASKKEIENTRKHYGLREIKKGTRLCLKCDAKFISQDLAKIRQCDSCRKHRD